MHMGLSFTIPFNERCEPPVGLHVVSSAEKGNVAWFVVLRVAIDVMPVNAGPTAANFAGLYRKEFPRTLASGVRLDRVGLPILMLGTKPHALCDMLRCLLVANRAGVAALETIRLVFCRLFIAALHTASRCTTHPFTACRPAEVRYQVNADFP